MTSASDHPVLRYVRRLAAHLAAPPPDAQLLERFAVRRDESAFAALVGRHGPLVLGACLRVLNDRHAAEDAFQATFLVLARKAALLRRPEALGPWLYGVATRTALKMRARQARRRQVEKQAAVGPAAGRQDDLVWRDLRPVLDEAVAALPERYRVPFVLHHLEGATVAEVARRLACPPGTVAARLARAKEKLRARLSRRGVTLSATAFAAALAGATATAGVPAVLATGSAASAALTKGVYPMMTLTQLKVAAALLVACVAGVGAGLSWRGTSETGRAGAGTGDVAAARPIRGAVADPGRAPADAETTSERFYAGGLRSLRGFEFRGGVQEFRGCEEADDARPSGRATTESGRPGDKVHVVELKVDDKEYRVPVGRGVRIVVPALGPVPVHLDFGFPVVKKPTEREQVFSFWLGLTG